MKTILFILFMLVYMPVVMLSLPVLLVFFMLNRRWAEDVIDWMFELPEKIFKL